MRFLCDNKKKAERVSLTGNLVVGLEYSLLHGFLLDLDLLFKLPAQVLKIGPLLVALIGSEGQGSAANLHDGFRTQSSKNQLQKVKTKTNTNTKTKTQTGKPTRQAKKKVNNSEKKKALGDRGAFLIWSACGCSGEKRDVKQNTPTTSTKQSRSRKTRVSPTSTLHWD